MAVYTYSIPWAVFDSDAADFVRNRDDGVLLDASGATIPTNSLLGVASPVRTGPHGTTVAVTASIPFGHVRFGAVTTAVWADEQANALATAQQAAADAASMRATVEAIASTASEVAYFYRDSSGDIWVSGEAVLVGGGVPRIDANGDPVVVFSSLI